MKLVLKFDMIPGTNQKEAMDTLREIQKLVQNNLQKPYSDRIHLFPILAMEEISDEERKDFWS